MSEQKVRVWKQEKIYRNRWNHPQELIDDIEKCAKLVHREGGTLEHVNIVASHDYPMTQQYIVINWSKDNENTSENI